MTTSRMTLRSVAAMLRPVRLELAFAIVATTASACFELLSLVVLAGLIGRGASGWLGSVAGILHFDQSDGLLLLLFATSALMMIASWFVAQARLAKLRNTLGAHYRLEALSAVTRTPVHVLAAASAGQTQNFVYDLAGQRAQAVESVANGICMLPPLIIMVSGAVMFSAFATAIVATLACLVIVLRRSLNARAERLAGESLRAGVAADRLIASALAGLRHLVATNTVGGVLARVEYAVGRSRSANIEREIGLRSVHALMLASSALLVAALLGASLVANGGITAAVTLVIPILYRTSPRILELQAVFLTLKDRKPAMAAYDAWIAGATVVDAADAIILDRFETLELRGIIYTPPGRTAPALDRLDLRIKAGTTVGVVGKTGAGKSTLIDAIAGLIDPEAGSIEVNGKPIATIARSRWRERFAWVGQDHALIYGSIADNVASFEATPDMAAVERALADASLSNFVKGLPDGVHTIIGDRGASLSGGQRQRLSIARALYRKPWLLVLDEPTSALDTVTEEEVLATIRALHGKLTIVMISHKFELLDFADEIIALAAGEVVARGRHGELRDRLEQLAG